MKHLLKNLQFKLLSGLFLFLLSIFLLFYFLLIATLNTHYNKELESLLSTTIKDITYEFKIGLIQKYNFEHIKEEFDIQTLYIQVITVEHSKGCLLAKSKDLKGETLQINVNQLKNLPHGKIYFEKQENKRLAPNPIEVGYALLEENENSAVYLMCAIPYERRNPEIENAKQQLFIGLSLLLVLILFIVNIIIKQSLAQTKNVLKEVKNIQIDSHMPKIKKTNIAREIDELIETFNALIGELQSSYKKIKEFGQNASHELKTPLTILRGEIEVGLRKERNTQEYKEILHSSLTEIQRVQDIIEKILFLSTNADSDIKSHFEPIYIDEILDEVIEQKKALAKLKDIELKIVQTNPLTIKGNALLINLALSNLLENSIKYSREHSHVLVTLEGDTLSIEDHGIGIAPQDLDKIFDRFYRCNKTEEGSGLGLSIVENILYLHDVTINIQSKLGEGTKVTLYFKEKMK